MADKERLFIEPGAVSLLIKIKQAAIKRSDALRSLLSSTPSTIARSVDQIVQGALQLETAYHDMLEHCRIQEDYVTAYRDLLKCYPDELEDDEVAELKELVFKWQQRREQDAADI